MQNNNKHPTENESKSAQEEADNVFESAKYIKQLELQRIVLNKMIDSNLDKLNQEQNKYKTKSNKPGTKK